MSYLRGKDYCNCEHATMLRDAIERALCKLPHRGADTFATRLILDRALRADVAACLDLWNETRQNVYPEGTPLHCDAPSDHPIWEAFPSLTNKESE